jgi:membrane-bound serine protease (ClpP class)
MLALLLLGAFLLLLGRAVPAAGGAVVLEVRGAIGPATSGFISQGLARARDDGADIVILQLDTPGGLDSAMRDIIKAILASPVPVATWVTPEGARAASAGTYILYASHVAAMSPATNLGAATPVQIGGAPGEPEPEPAPREEAPPANDRPAEDPAADATADNGAAAPDRTEERPAPRRPGTAAERKAISDAVAYIRGLAELRGRNADWAEEAVREAVSLGSREALERNVIDLIARPREGLEILSRHVVPTSLELEDRALRDVTIARLLPF